MKLKYDESLSNFAFNVNLRLYIEGLTTVLPSAADLMLYHIDINRVKYQEIIDKQAGSRTLLPHVSAHAEITVLRSFVTENETTTTHPAQSA